MGWGDCGQDSKGRNIGYVWPATCDHPGCKTKIHRGLAYACGDMHGQTADGCEGYFCPDHLVTVWSESEERHLQVCVTCGDDYPDLDDDE